MPGCPAAWNLLRSSLTTSGLRARTAPAPAPVTIDVTTATTARITLVMELVVVMT